VPFTDPPQVGCRRCGKAMIVTSPDGRYVDGGWGAASVVPVAGWGDPHQRGQTGKGQPEGEHLRSMTGLGRAGGPA
jgi:hypothetical protein